MVLWLEDLRNGVLFRKGTVQDLMSCSVKHEWAVQNVGLTVDLEKV